MKKIYALIPVRKGSSRIKDKNFKFIGKKPLYQIALNQALKSKFISKVFIATDSKRIKKNNKKIFIFNRSKKSSTSKAQTEIVIKEFLNKYDCEYLVLIQATNIFIKAKHLDKAINKLLSNKKFNSLLSVVRSKFLIWKKKKNLCFATNYNYKERPRSQDINNSQLIENGSFYIFKRKDFLKYNNRLSGRITYFEMPKKSLFEIDDEEDLELVRKIY